ncbi:MAG: signal peptidase II, partial [Clostridia bacterium]
MRTLPKFSMLTAITAFAVVALDQITKILVRMYIPLYAEVPFIPYFMKLTHSQNSGASFGILKNNRWIFMVCSTVAIIAIIAFLIYEIRKKEPKRNSLFMVALSFVVGGGI